MSLSRSGTRKDGAAVQPSETARERDLYKYYQPPPPAHSQASSSTTSTIPPRSSTDPALTAFAQLATLRLNTRRALISLISRRSQYILAEATQTLSLQSDSIHNDRDELWFGCTTLPRSDVLCEKALETVPPAYDGGKTGGGGGGTASMTTRRWPLVINDLPLDPEFSGRPFALAHPTLRFYAATPIRTKAGFNIGTLCVMDEVPRHGLTEIEVRFLADMAVTIMDHLEMGRVKEEHRRSEKMVKGLVLFVEGRVSLAGGYGGGGGGGRTGTGVPGTPVITATQGSTPSREDKSRLDERDSVGESEADTLTPSPSTSGSELDVLPFPPMSSKPTLSSPLSGSSPSPRLSPTTAGAARDSSRDSSGGSSDEPLFPTFVNPANPLLHSAAELREMLLSEDLKKMFSRASNIIRECIEVDGAIFLDASIGTFGGQISESHHAFSVNSHPSSVHNSTPSTSEEELVGGGGASERKGSIPMAPTGLVSEEGMSRGTSQFSIDTVPVQREADAELKCSILGWSRHGNSSLAGDEPPESYRGVAEKFLQGLLHEYPRGRVIDLRADGSMLGKRGKGGKRAARYREADVLLKMLPGAQSVIFFPLWDSHRERWFAGSFAWTARSTRTLTRSEDLSYLAAFGNSIMAQVARLDVMAADRAKSDFISSISHELRSPLHGILASVEFLHETTVDLFQHSMIDTIERCGRTLLDTIQHVLDFAKINNFRRPEGVAMDIDRGKAEALRDPFGGPLSKMMSLSVDMDLSVVTEDVIYAVYVGHEFQDNSSLEVSDEASGFPSEGVRSNNLVKGEMKSDAAPYQLAIKKERLEIIVDIGWRANWTFTFQSGALRRVLMNLFGNALKYTDSGWVKVSLQSEDVPPTAENPQQRSIITITISDSGRGISPEFLNIHLFTPFTQENPLNPGTGLGLSIVLQIVRSLGGTIDVRSELGIGTEVKVTVTLAQATLPPRALANADGKYAHSTVNTKEKTEGLILGLVGFDHHVRDIFELDASQCASPSQPDPAIALQESLEDMAANWFGMSMEATAGDEPDIYIANEKPIPRAGASEGTPMIVLCSNASVYRAYTQRKEFSPNTQGALGLIHFVSKPCGPHKLAKAFAFCQSDTANRLSLTPALISPLIMPSALDPFGLDPLGAHYYPSAAPVPGTPPQGFPVQSEKGAAGGDGVERRMPVLLLVEDNKINLKLLETFTKKNKCLYKTASNGREALEAFRDAPGPFFDIIFMDLSMPIMSGIESARAMRQLEVERGQKRAIIVALTGLGGREVRQEAFGVGIDYFVVKPVSFRELGSFLAGWKAGW